MMRAFAVLAVLPVFGSVLFAQATGAPNHSTGNPTRTQTIQVGEPYTTAPGGNPGRTTGRTGNQSPFGQNPPAAPPPPSKPPSAQGGCTAATPQAPTQILSNPVTYNGATATVGIISVAPDADLTGILCLLDTISRSPSGAALINAIQSDGQKRNLTVQIIKPDAGVPGPSTRPGSGGDLDWLKAQPDSLSPVYSSQPIRPKAANGLPDFSADGVVQPPISKIVVFGAGVAGIRGKGVSSAVRFSPSMFPLNAPGIRQSSNAGADVGLIHELIHCLRHIDGIANRTPVFKANDNTVADGTWLTVDEREVIGDSTVPAKWVTENRYRAERGLPARACVAPSCF